MGTNYSRGIIKQIEELTLENERLSTENKRLRAENKELRGQMEQMSETIIKLMEEINRLKAQINKNSGNSSKPPSQDGFKRVPNSREKSGRSRGGQPGHPGHRLKLPKNLDELVEKGMVRRELIDHTEGADRYVTRYVVDVAIETVVTEHRFHAGQIPREYNNEITYGSKVKALTVLLSNEGMIAEGRLSDFFQEITHGVLNPSEATIESFMAEFAGKLDTEIETIQTSLLNESVLHVDETPMRCTEKPEYSGGDIELSQAEGKSLEIALRTHSSQTATLYTVNPRKDDEGVKRDGILPRFTGIISQDHETKFYKYGTAHATCGAHLLRELRGLFELQKIPWAEEMRKLMSRMNAHKNTDIAAGKTACHVDALAAFERDYDHLIVIGRAALAKLKQKELGRDELRRMLNRLTGYKDCYLLFIRDYRAPFTNNLAERDLRPCKTKQKISGCFRSWTGAGRYAKTRSFISTLKKRSANIFVSVSLVLSGTPVLS
jgi:uncharacterized small protein (DUF1192 family)